MTISLTNGSPVYEHPPFSYLNRSAHCWFSFNNMIMCTIQKFYEVRFNHTKLKKSFCRRLLRVPAVLAMTLSFCGKSVLAAGSCAGAAISGASVDTVNGPWTCHINDPGDKVSMVANASDYDSTSEGCACGEGNNITLAATTWVVSSGVLDSATGSANSWKAGTSIGNKTLTVTFKDDSSNPLCDDNDKEVQKTLTAFKVGVHLASSGGSSLTRWEDDAPGPIGFQGDWQLNKILTSSSASDGRSSVATWTLKNNPAGTPMKKYIHATTHAAAFGGGDNSGRIYAVTADNDSDGSGPFGLIDISLSAGFVSLTPNLGTDGDETVAVLAAAAGFSSELHSDYSRKVELVSATTTGPSDTKGISHSPGDAQLIGSHDHSARAEWEISYEMKKVASGGNWASAEVEIEMIYDWGVTETNPYYGS